MDFCILYGKFKIWTEKTTGGGGQTKKKKEEEFLDHFGGLVLDCITTVSGVQSVIAECSLYICVHSILQEKRKTVE